MCIYTSDLHVCMMTAIAINVGEVLAIMSLAAMEKVHQPPLVIAQDGDLSVGVVIYLLLFGQWMGCECGSVCGV